MIHKKQEAELYTCRLLRDSKQISFILLFLSYDKRKIRPERHQKCVE
jgi:hypothetical protein